jgi:hypothetical protein
MSVLWEVVQLKTGFDSYTSKEYCRQGRVTISGNITYNPYQYVFNVSAVVVM